ncbi:MAG: hypothetical protein U0271_14705 [Polyangiaceae bacterium]
MRPLVITLLSTIISFASIGCEREGGGGPAPENCSTDDASYADEGPSMEPGGDCISCHSSGEGPRYNIAGTVMGASNDDDRCVGISDVSVEITDANGEVITLQSNGVGNFYSRSSFAAPYTAKVTQGGRENVMTTPQSDGNCASCHTAEGAHGAPGRILAP